MEYVIIGNSTAAVGCIEGIRSVDQDGRITVISDEPYHTYSRPLISYLLYGKTDEQKMKYRPDGFYEQNGVKTLLGKKAVSIDKEKKAVILSDGAGVPYDALLVATGSRPFIPPTDGFDTVKNSFTFMTLDSAKALEAALTKDSKVLVVGAGLIGLKCVEGIADKCGSVTVIDLADRVMPSVLDGDGAKLVQSSIEKHGVKFILSDCVEKYEGNKAVTKNGRVVEFDILVTAVGVRPNTELVKAAGGNVQRGIVIDSHCKTDIPDIFAAGDCTESYDVSSEQNKILALLPNAYMQGFCGGVNMAGGSAEYTDAIPQNAIGFFGYHMITAGSCEGEKIISQDGENYKMLAVKDNRLSGFIMIGDINRAGIYTSLVRNRTPLDSIDFELIQKEPQLMAFTASKRAQMLGGAHE